MKLNYKRTILVGFAFFLINAFRGAYDAIIPLILNNHYGLPNVASGAVMSLDNVLVLGIVFATSNIYMEYSLYVVAVCCAMLIGLTVFVFTVKEKTWAEQMQADSERLGLVDNEDKSVNQKELSKPELKPLLLILFSVALSFITMFFVKHGDAKPTPAGVLDSLGGADD